MSSSWSPFDCLVVADQTQAGLLKNESAEVNVLTVDNTELRSANTDPMVPLNANMAVDTTKANSGNWNDRTPKLMVQLTTHRIVFWNDSSSEDRQRSARFLHHSQIMHITAETAYFKSPKLLLNTAALGDLYLVFARDKARLRDDFHQALQKVLSRQEWNDDDVIVGKATMTDSTNNAAISTLSVAAAAAHQQRAAVSAPRRRVGVDAILTQNARRHERAAQVTDAAFQGDAETLLKEAKEMVQIINKYVATLDRQQSSASSSSTSSDQEKLVGMLQNMGMTSALSKADFAGREDAYQEQVARELADFLRPKFRLQNAPPVIPLTDVYCLFNRARGSSLLSPDDLVAAAKHCKRLQLGLSLHTFPSGLMVLQDDSRADPEQVADRLLRELLPSAGGNSLTAVQVSRAWHISAVLALEQLQAVERLGYLVRDETLESLRFYPNRFAEWLVDEE